MKFTFYVCLVLLAVHLAACSGSSSQPTESQKSPAPQEALPSAEIVDLGPEEPQPTPSPANKSKPSVNQATKQPPKPKTEQSISQAPEQTPSQNRPAAQPTAEPKKTTAIARKPAAQVPAPPPKWAPPSNFREIHRVKHRHSFVGDCTGKLILTASQLDYQPDAKIDHLMSFALTTAVVEFRSSSDIKVTAYSDSHRYTLVSGAWSATAKRVMTEK